MKNVERRAGAKRNRNEVEIAAGKQAKPMQNGMKKATRNEMKAVDSDFADHSPHDRLLQRRQLL